MRTPTAFRALLCALPLVAGLMAAEIKPFAGAGHAAAEKAFFGQEKENQKALDRAQSAAVSDALREALAETVGGLDPERLAALRKDLSEHDAAFVRDTIVTDSGMDGLNATVKVKVKVDLGELKAYLKRQGISLTSGLAAKFKFFVLSYTVEGMDAKLNAPIVLHEEVRAESQSSTTAGFSSSSSASSSVQGYHADQAVVVSPYGGGGAAASATGVRANSANATQASGDYAHSGSASFLRVVDYADPTRKGLSSSNEVRALLEGMLHRADLKVGTVESPLVGQEFKSEDEFVNFVLRAVRKHGEVDDNDCVVIALNSLTPIDAGSRFRFTSKVTLRAVKVQDGANLLDSESFSKTSGEQLSADAARTQSTKLCLAAIQDTLPEQVRNLMKDLQSVDAQAAPAPAGLFTIQVGNLQDRRVLVPFKQWLRQQGFSQFRSDTRAGGSVEIVTISLGDKSPEEVKDILDALPPGFQMLAKSDAGAKLQVR